MNRFDERFALLGKKSEGAFVPFVVLGDPDAKTSLEMVKALIDNGADALELGFPFSDPIADGPTVQAADQRALDAGIDTDKCLLMIGKIRSHDAKIPISLLVYYNLVFQRGISKFCRNAVGAGVDALLIADMPIEESDYLLEQAKKHGISQVFLVAPTTPNSRIRAISSKCSAYLYVVSLLGVTGARTSLQGSAVKLIKRIRPLSKLPLLVGFGISKPKHVKEVIKAGADGVIVGSAIINIIKENLGKREKMLEAIALFARQMKAATRP